MGKKIADEKLKAPMPEKAYWLSKHLQSLEPIQDGGLVRHSLLI